MYHIMSDEEFDSLTDDDLKEWVFLLPTSKYGFWEIKSFDPKFANHGFDSEVELDPDDDFAVFTNMCEDAKLKISWIEDPSEVFEVYEFIYKTFDYPGMYFPMSQREADLLRKAKSCEISHKGKEWRYVVPGVWLIIESATKTREPTSKEYKELNEFLDKQA